MNVHVAVAIRDAHNQAKKDLQFQKERLSITKRQYDEAEEQFRLANSRLVALSDASVAIDVGRFSDRYHAGRDLRPFLKLEA